MVRYGLGGKPHLVHADTCNLGSGFLATDFMSFLQSPDTQVQNMKPNSLSHM